MLLHKAAAGLGKPTVKRSRNWNEFASPDSERNELSLLAGDLYKKISIGHIVYLNLIPDPLQPQTLLMAIACNQITCNKLGGKLIVVLH